MTTSMENITNPSPITIIVNEVTYSSGPKRVSVLCDDVEEVRGMVNKFLGASGGAGGTSGSNDHEPSLKITRKTMKREEFDALEDWDGGGGEKAGKGIKP